jgi:hypothetical protein
MSEAIEETIRKGDWLLTYSGVRFWPLDPRPEEILIRDIAHSLSQLCRFTGHTNQFYSVAQHCCYVSRFCPPEDALWGLLHDASEAYLIDLPPPLKHHSLLGVHYREAEKEVMRAVCERFGLPVEMPDSVREADEILLAAEGVQLMNADLEEWGLGRLRADSEGIFIKPWSPSGAQAEFLWQLKKLLRPAMWGFHQSEVPYESI